MIDERLGSQELVEDVCARSGRAMPVLRRAGDDAAYAEWLLRETYAFEPTGAPTVSDKCGERAIGGALDVVGAAMERCFRAAANPRNVLCKGMCRRSEMGREPCLRGSSEVGVRCASSAYEAFKTPAWDTFCDRAGEDVMLHVILYCSVFIRVGLDGDSPLLQICGYPINDTIRKQAVTNAMATSKARAGVRREQRARKKQRREELIAAEKVAQNHSAVESKCVQEKQLTANPFISSVDVHEVIRLSEVYRASQISVDEDVDVTDPSSDAPTASNKSMDLQMAFNAGKKSSRKPSWFRRSAAKRSTKAQEAANEGLKAPAKGKVVNRSAKASFGNQVKIANEVYDRGVFMFRSSFTKKPGFPASHVLRVCGPSNRAARRLFVEIFKSKKVIKTSKHKTARAVRQAKSTYRIPRKYREALLPSLRATIDRARKCPFARLLNKHAPMPRKLVVSSSRIDAVSTESLLSAYTAPRKVAEFVWEVLKSIVPDALLGSKRTRESLRDTIKRMVSMRRYERITLHEVMQGVRTSDFTCFKALRTNASNAGQAEASQRRLTTKWISWLVKEMIFPIIRAHFYVTDTQLHKNRIFYYRKGVWSRLVTATLQGLEETSFRRLPAREAMKLLDRVSLENNLGFSNMRFLPKGSGLRPIATLNKPSTFTVKLGRSSSHRIKRFEAVNARLKDVQDILYHETVRDPDVMGSAVGDYKSVLMRLGPCLRTIRRERLVGRNPQPFIIATDIKGAFDNLPIDSLERVATNLISSSSYQTLHYVVVKHDGEQKYKKLVSSVAATSKQKIPGPLFTEANKRMNTGSVVMLKRESKNAVIVDAGFAKDISEANVVPLLRAHLRENIVSARGKFFLQTVGIPQGSIVSPLLCSLFFGHLEHEYKLLSGFCGDHSTVCRWMDDMLIVTTNKEQAIAFLAACKRGFSAHGCSLNDAKTLSNFDHEDEVHKKTFVNADGRNYIPWCGLLIDCLTLEIMVDYSRYSGEFVRESMNLPLGRKVWTRLPDRICGFIKPKCAAIFYDESINSKVTVRANVFQLFLMAAMKTHSYVVAASATPGCNQIAPIALYRAIERAVRFGQVLIQRQTASARANCGSLGRISNRHVEFLATKAFLQILGRKQTRYTRVLQLLNSRLTASDMKRASRNALLAQAMDPSRHTIFSHIRY